MLKPPPSHNFSLLQQVPQAWLPKGHLDDAKCAFVVTCFRILNHLEETMIKSKALIFVSNSTPHRLNPISKLQLPANCDMSLLSVQAEALETNSRENIEPSLTTPKTLLPGLALPSQIPKTILGFEHLLNVQSCSTAKLCHRTKLPEKTL